MNKYLIFFTELSLSVFATRDWHPANHCSFVEQGGPWPPHCVAGTPGAAFVQELLLPAAVPIISKAVTPEKESYSDFADTDLDKQLHSLGIKRLFIGGLVTDYCVLSTVLDGLRNGYTVFLLLDAILAVDVKPGDGEPGDRGNEAARGRTFNLCHGCLPDGDRYSATYVR